MMLFVAFSISAHELVFMQLCPGLAPTRSAIVQAVTSAQALQMRKVRALKYTVPSMA
jgi:hypothetical protein